MAHSVQEPSKILNSLLVTISYAFPIRHAVTPEPQENTTFVFSSILFFVKILCNSFFFYSTQLPGPLGRYMVY